MQETAHTVKIDEKCISLTGITEIVSFNDTSFEALTERGSLQITGIDLKMDKTSVETGEVIIAGRIISVYYPDDSITRKKSGLRSIFG